MSSVQAMSLMFYSSSSCCSYSRRSIKATFDISNQTPKVGFTNNNSPQQINYSNDVPLIKTTKEQQQQTSKSNDDNNLSAAKLRAILEAVSDRIDVHDNVARQRDNWNRLLLASLNAFTLSAATLSGIAAVGAHDHSLLALKLGSALLFSAAAGISAVMSAIQPSQLAEEQRNASRLFRRIREGIRADRGRSPDESDVEEAVERVLALDRAYPLPLLGHAMIKKFPAKFEPAFWWPQKKHEKNRIPTTSSSSKQWSEEMREEMREIARVLKCKDLAEYERIGNLALKVNKVLAVLGPLLAVFAAASAAWFDHGGSSAAVVGGAVASVVSTVEHGGQVGMVVEMYRSCAGYLKLTQETIEQALDDDDDGIRRENEELFRLKMALRLGRSLTELSGIVDEDAIDEFACKLF